MKILYLNYSPSVVQFTRTYGVANGLRKQGHEVIVINMHRQIKSNIKRAREQASGVSAPAKIQVPASFVSAPPTYTPGFFAMLKGEIRRSLANHRYLWKEYFLFMKHNPDMVIVRPMAIWSIFLSADLFKQKLIFDTDGPLLEAFQYPFNDIPRFYLKMEPVFMRQLWSIITISTKMKEHYAAFGGNPDRIFICPNGIDGDRFRPEIDASPIREQYRLGGKTVIGFMGNLEPWHGLSGLLDKFPELAEKYDNLCLLLVGIPPLDWDNLPDSIDKRLVNYKDKIICTGKIAFDSMPMHLKAIDIFVLPYANMDFFYFSPLKLFESMGVGCAVVGSDIGQVGEVITDGQDGLLFPPGNYEEMGARISKLIENPQIRTSLGQAAADNIHRNYTWEKITGGMIDAFYYSFGKYIPHLPPNS